MTGLDKLLESRGIRAAVVIDDGYDAVPKATDLEGADVWANFFTDAEMHHDALAATFPAYDDLSPEELRSSNRFVEALWNAKAAIPELWNPLFEDYRQAIATDRKFLDELEKRLATLGLSIVKSGREPPQEAVGIPLIFADLFLGTTQQDADIDLSLTALKPMLEGHRRQPPCVVLMSRSELLRDKKERFRDGAGLLGAMFRAYSKAQLLEGRNLETTLERLALHRPDALRVARFVHGWKEGLETASRRFLMGIGRLDLSDYAQIRDVLLAFEGQPLGSYMLDVFDRVLAHEIEGDVETVNAAQELNLIEPARYLAPHIAGSTDLQDLVFRTIWQNPGRLKVKTTVEDIPVGFGDMLVRKDLIGAGHAVEGPDVYVVMTPACDLVRKDGAKRVVLLSGTVTDIAPKSWTYSKNTFKTPIMKLTGDRRVFVRWDAKDIVTLTQPEMKDLLSQGGRYSLHLRLKEAHALELQQRLLAEMGRVGLVAHMPGTFPVQVEAHFHSPAGLKKLTLEVATREGGVCYVGRDEDGDEHTRLVMTEAAIDELLAQVDRLSAGDVHEKTKPSLGRLQKAKSLSSMLQRGLLVPRSDKVGFAHIKANVTADDGADTEVVVGLVGRNPVTMKVDVKNAALVLVVTDAEPRPAAAETQVEVDEAPEGTEC